MWLIWSLVTVCRTQCPSANLMDCLTTFLVWLAVILQSFLDEEPHWVEVLFHCCRRDGDCSWGEREITLLRCGLRHRAQIYSRNRLGEDPRLCRQKHHFYRRWMFPLRLYILFQPSFVDNEANECHDTSCKYNTKCDADIRTDLYVHVMLSGDTTVFQWIF